MKKINIENPYSSRALVQVLWTIRPIAEKGLALRRSEHVKRDEAAHPPTAGRSSERDEKEREKVMTSERLVFLKIANSLILYMSSR